MPQVVKYIVISIILALGFTLGINNVYINTDKTYKHNTILSAIKFLVLIK